LYGDQPAGWEIGGTPETISNMKPADLRQWFDKNYVAKNPGIFMMDLALIGFHYFNSIPILFISNFYYYLEVNDVRWLLSNFTVFLT